jgi:hypothetical protein
MTDTPAKTAAELETELLLLQQTAVLAVQKALVIFNKAIAPHIPASNRLGSEAGHTLTRVASQSLAFENEIERAVARIDQILNPPANPQPGAVGFPPAAPL